MYWYTFPPSSPSTTTTTTTMADTMVAQPAAAAAQQKSKHAHAASQSQPRKVRFNVGANYKVLDVIGEGVSDDLLTRDGVRNSLVFGFFVLCRLMVSSHLPCIVQAVARWRSKRSRPLTTQCALYHSLYLLFVCLVLVCLLFPFSPLAHVDRFALRTLRELKLLVYWSECGVSENVRANNSDLVVVALSIIIVNNGN